MQGRSGKERPCYICVQFDCIVKLFDYLLENYWSSRPKNNKMKVKINYRLENARAGK